jgi:hypothetical protein
LTCGVDQFLELVNKMSRPLSTQNSCAIIG